MTYGERVDYKMTYSVIFQCTNANYHWIVEKNLSLEEAEELVRIKNKYNKIHGGCCQYYLQSIT
jgi:hypothetical protein